jgi:hypothetical protein
VRIGVTFASIPNSYPTELYSLGHGTFLIVTAWTWDKFHKFVMLVLTEGGMTLQVGFPSWDSVSETMLHRFEVISQ